jgi:formylglycine-generating enzyme required for sulfatase activity
VLDARADAAAQPFPDESARDVTIEGGEFDLRLSAAQDGPAWLRLRATDKFDLRAEVLPVRVRFDTTRPELTVSSPSDGSLVPDEVVVTGTVADVTPVSVSVDGNAATMGEGGAWRCELDLAHSPNAGRKLAIVARDEGGLETRSELRLRVDAEKPALTLMHPKVQPFITRDTSVTIAGTVQDDSAVQLMLDGNQIAVGAGGVFTTDVALSRDGDYEFALAATDAVGNASEALKVVVTRATGPRAGDAIATDIGLKMIYVAPQEFVMGSPEGEAGRDSDETLHRVKITKGYWLGETEVTQGQWKAVMGTEPWKDQSYTQQGSAVAATHVSWSDAMEFCRKLTERERAAGRLPEGYRYILPTEAEWELACRAGSTTAYCYGDDASELAKYAVFGKSLEGGFANVAKEQRRANRWGFFDMHGNVWEWCLDEADLKDGVVTTTYRDGIEDPYNTSGPQRVFRGGS